MADPKARRSLGRWRLATFIFSFVALVLFICIVAILITIHTRKKKITTCESKENGQYGHIDLKESDNPSVFHDLTSKEVKGLMKYLYSQKTLNLVKTADMKVNTSYVFLSELYLPRKNSVLDYLDKKATKPAREARVILLRGDKQTPDIEEIIVGPLPNPTGHRPNPNRKKSIPFIYRPITGPEHVGSIEMVTVKVDQVLGTMFEDVYDGKLFNCNSKCLMIRYITPVSSVQSGEKRRKTWYWLSQTAEYFILHPLDFSVLVDLDGPNFTIEQVWFDGKLYKTLTDVLDYYEANKGSFSKIKFPDVSSDLFSTMNQRGTPPISPPLRNPVQVSPDGKRYNVKDRHVEYMSWQFDFGMSPIRGPQLYDLRFKNERIAYELSLQELSVFYAGYKPMQALANYLDGVGLIGIQAKGLVPGVDCPKDATYLSSTFQVESDGPFSFENAFCIFEYNLGMPLRRHHSYSFSYGRFYEGMETTVLILRTIAVIINYDYVIDFMFYPNGAMQVKVVSTGYVLGTFYTDNESKYSFKLHENLAANIHQHLFNFKVDLDIQGTANRFATANIETEDIPNKFSKDSNARLIQHKFSTSLKTTEKDAAYKFDFEAPKYLLVYKEDVKTRKTYKKSKSYRILNNGMSKLILPEGKGNEPSISWARYQVAMTKYNDSEPTSSSLYSILDAEDPIVHFQNFIDDNESIVDEDLVAWITMGIHHIPHTEDLPVTPTPGMELSFYLLPYNYFDEDPAISSLNAVRIEPKDNAKLKTSININRYGVKQSLQCVPEKNKYDEEIKENPSLIIDTEGGTFL
ncbi:putative amine oxidase [copper-containing] [Mytilus californianus]|uniref:putative amine oxidase [copper-containing] n=1 Tax=Mytilus californianus TaxID=6549 RepID=UPI00224624F4|nr:putative amine oxidase [copper-containing] [Mytilus californianus]XP_052068804.1 putative amine oxidase [copper-containing] [Mytilus californianus]XP_052068809.1 putative amine oxidase [copper-containing] [Mytilus californianus]